MGQTMKQLEFHTSLELYDIYLKTDNISMRARILWILLDDGEDSASSRMYSNLFANIRIGIKNNLY